MKDTATMPFSGMELGHPIDEEIRKRLRAAEVNQIAFSAAIGRSQSWLSRYIAGEGKASIDDAIRITAVLMGVGGATLTDDERRLLRALRKLPPDDQLDVVAYAEHRGKLVRRTPSIESSAPETGMRPATAHKAPGKRKAARG